MRSWVARRLRKLRRRNTLVEDVLAWIDTSWEALVRVDQYEAQLMAQDVEAWLRSHQEHVPTSFELEALTKRCMVHLIAAADRHGIPLPEGVNR